jgi:hypothetical protein
MSRAFAIALFVLLSWRPATAAFHLPEGRPCADVPFRLIDNRAVFDVTIAGQGPFHFVFDTGANSILDRDLARALNLPLDDAGQTGGAGAEAQPVWRLRVPSLAFGGVKGHDAHFLSLDLSEIRRAIGFERLDGLMGREVLDAFLVRYDYDRSALSICDPKAAPPEMRAGTPVPFAWTSWEVPIVRAELDGIAGDFMIDTGDRSSLTAFRGFTNQNGLRTRYAPRVRTVTGQGVGGPIPADVVRAGALRFGGFQMSGVTLRLPLLETGGFATDELAGSIGSGVMRRYNATYDYGARRIYLEPNSYFSRPDRYDRSGLWLVAHPQGYLAASVADGGPAAQAGLKAGDVLTHTDGAAAKGQSLIAFRDFLMDAAPGRRVNIRFSRVGAPAGEATLVLKDLLAP